MNRKEIIAKVAEVVAHAKNRLGVEIPTPTVAFYSRGRVAGRAYYMRNHLEFNEILARENPDKFHETVIHEISHLITHKRYPHAKQSHGPEFKYVDQVLGGRGTRCHDYDVSTVSTKKRKVRYEAKCQCGKSYFLTKNMIDRITNPSYRCACRTCGSANIKATGLTKVIL